MLKAVAQTNIGKTRTVNQDTVFVSMEAVGCLPNLFIVADGMGGHKGGDVASSVAIESFCEFLRGAASGEEVLDVMTSAARSANDRVVAKAAESDELSGMGTTMTACTIFEGKYFIVHIGDSRAYKITEDEIVQLTNDHSYVNEMVKAGQITHDEAKGHPRRNILTRVLGVNDEMAADGYVAEVSAGSVILLCSDGLYNMVAEPNISEIIKTHENPARALIEAANEKGGTDNISVIVINI